MAGMVTARHQVGAVARARTAPRARFEPLRQLPGGHLAICGAAVAASLAVALLGYAREVPAGELDDVISLTIAATGTAAAILGELAGRLSEQRWLSWFGAALALYSLVVVPSTGLTGPFGTSAGALQVGRFLAYAGVFSLLLVGLRPPTRLRRRTSWLVVVMVTLLIAAVDGLLAAPLDGVTSLRAPQGAPVAVLVLWCGLALGYVGIGYRRARPIMVGVGAGLVVIAVAQLHQVLSKIPDTDPDLLFSLLRLASVTGIVGVLAWATLAAVRDVRSEQWRREEELRIAVLHHQRATETTRERDHDLRSGLLGLSGITELIGGSDRDPERQRLRQAVLAELARLRSMMAEAAPVEDDQDAFPVQLVLDRLVTLRRRSGLDVRLRTVGDPWVTGRPTALAEAVTNVLANAERHAPGSPVYLSAVDRGDRVVVEVRDEGPGIPPGAEERVFGRGVREGSSGGEGLGLHLTRQLLHDLGGSIRFRPADPWAPGATAVIELPIADLPPVPWRESPERASSPAQQATPPR